jgi:hypothetical protein
MSISRRFNMTLEGIAQAKDQAIKSQSRKRPSSSTSPLTTTLQVYAAKREVEHKYSAHRAIEKKLAGLGVLASSEEVEAFAKEFTALQGVAALDALIKPLKKARKRYLAQQKPVAEPKKEVQRSKPATTSVVRKRIWSAWRELLSSLGARKRTTLKEFKPLVRREFPQADLALVKKVRSEVYEYHRLNG